MKRILFCLLLLPSLGRASGTFEIYPEPAPLQAIDLLPYEHYYRIDGDVWLAEELDLSPVRFDVQYQPPTTWG